MLLESGSGEGKRIDGVDGGAQDGDCVGAELSECVVQCSCLGSDQPDRPVTALNCRSN